ncbi:hypothetical protein [Pelagicoccus albus]|uniref:Uncharacterized protein n=1 Tax=Pelagicoccus albus TaxID=415222 RepID=A0A7X1E974_9BACT|nr:hypothetical protein [Pelagicoccus albus]MBC2607129.1 hypothetical protein [Pelagicoccus albus]
MTTIQSSFKRAFGAIASLVFALSLHADPVSVGDTMPKLSGTDQHEKPYAIESGTRYVLASYEMGPGKQANAFLDEKGANFLPENKAVYVANIHGMPGIIANTFALPKMRKYSHRILVMNEDGLFDEWPQEKGKVAVFTLDAEGKITHISQWSPKSGEAPF